MRLSEELQERINNIFKSDDELRKKLLSGDAETIRKIGSISQKGMNPEDVLEALESNDSETIQYLYAKAKRMIEMKKLYKDLCDAYTRKDVER